MGVRERNHFEKEFNILLSATRFVRRTGIHKKWHTIYSMWNESITHGGHPAILALLNPRLAGIGMTADFDWCDRQPQSKLYDSRLDCVRRAFFEKCIPENAAIPILVTECSIFQLF